MDLNKKMENKLKDIQFIKLTRFIYNGIIRIESNSYN